jgi:hypothetical protein
LERGEAYTGFWCGNLRESEPMEDPGLNGRIILRYIFRKCDVGAWTGQDKDRWRTLVKTVMDFLFP